MRIAIAVICAATALGATLSASTIGVSSKTSQQLQNGDSLEFLFSTWSYVSDARETGNSADPDSIDFVFSSLPVSATGDFTATLESFSGTASVSFSAPLNWETGYLQSSQYAGVTSAITGSLDLSSAESTALFSGGYADLVLSYAGPAVTVGIPGNTLPHDLTVSLSGGSLSVGALVYTAGYESAASESAEYTTASLLVNNALVFAPEPASGLLIGAGIGLCVFAGILKRIGGQRARYVIPRG